MSEISNFIKTHKVLCALTLGLAIVGYLGVHAVRKIIAKCQKTQKIDALAQKNLNQPQAPQQPQNKPLPVTHLNAQNAHKPLLAKPQVQQPMPMIDLSANLAISSDPISLGQGEYLVFHQSEEGTIKQLSEETFEKVYEVLLQYNPKVMVDQQENRHALLQEALQKIDPTLTAVFVPKTLYELVFIRKCISEDIKHNSICDRVSRKIHKTSLATFKGDEAKFAKFQETQNADKIKRKCWHVCYFQDAGDDQHAGVKEIAKRLNKTLCKNLQPRAAGFTYQQMKTFVENELDFLKTHYETTKQKQANNEDFLWDSDTPGPTTNFSVDSNYVGVHPMGIRDDKAAQIVLNALALECSDIAKRSLFLFRGSEFQKDAVVSGRGIPYTLSYGTGLFSGCIFDGGATAFKFMRADYNSSAHAIPVPYDQIEQSPFYIPKTHTVTQLFGDGEIFHARSKVHRDADIKSILGFHGFGKTYNREPLRSYQTQDELIASFQNYKAQAIQMR